MALKAGYKGVKKTLIDAIKNLSGAVVIKTVGDGLNLTNAGKLNVKAATASAIGGVKVGAGLSINNGVLSADTQSLVFSTSEFDTGWKWIDGKTIYGKVFNNQTLPNNALSLFLPIAPTADIDKVLYWNITEGLAGTQRCMDYRIYANLTVSDNNLCLVPTHSAKAMAGVDVTVFYTKVEEV